MIVIEYFKDLEDYECKSDIIAELILDYIILLEIDKRVTKEGKEEFHLSY